MQFCKFLVGWGQRVFHIFFRISRRYIKYHDCLRGYKEQKWDKKSYQILPGNYHTDYFKVVPVEI